MTRSTLRPAAAAAVAVLALASLAACGGDDDGDGAETSSESSDSSTDASDDPDASERGTDDPDEVDDPEEADDTDAPDDPDGAEEVGDEIDPDEFIDTYAEAMDKATTATLKMSFAEGSGVEGKGAADFSTTPPSMALVIADPSTGQNQRMVILDGKAYLGLSDKQYIEYDLSDPNSPLGDLTDQLDPTAMVEVFEDGIIRSAYVGEETVSGESMERYSVIVDGAAMLADLPSGAPSPAAQDEVQLDLWFDQDGMVRRQEATLGGTGGSVELNYDNWGEPVDIKAPPKSQVTRLP